LDQNVANRFRVQVTEDRVEWKTVRWPKREHNRVFGGRCLQFKIETATETLAQGQTPGAIQTAAERRMNDDMRADIVLKETLDDYVLLRRHHAESEVRQREILDDLLRGSVRQPNFN